jgi:hypothetical protein
LDPVAKGLICLEEPENGIHPERIPAMLNLLKDIATDCDEPVDNTNPLRQVIVNTHSPAVVLEAPDESLLVVEAREGIQDGRSFRKAVFSCLPETWREKADPAPPTLSKGKLLAYLNPVSSSGEAWDGFYAKVGRQTLAECQKRNRRVADREDMQQLLPHVAE